MCDVGNRLLVAAVRCCAAGRIIDTWVDVANRFRKQVLNARPRVHLVPDTAVVSDGLKAFPIVADVQHVHLRSEAA